ncbi:MAG: phosphoketolase family protein, partial [Elusimicrobia bacterium]|nr:phosphoketolase family protein [Elusimicrobiota bacterium]
TAWHSNKFLNPACDGAVLPILHLNGFKIANPSLLSRIPRAELEQLMRGYGWAPLFVEGHESGPMHEAMAAALDLAVARIKEIQDGARRRGDASRPRWPMIVLDSPKGWTGPKVVDGKTIEGTFRAHQVPLTGPRTNPDHLRQLELWLKSYRPEELFDEGGRLRPELAELSPKGARRMGANPRANGGLLLRDLRMPDFRGYGLEVAAPGVRGPGDTRVLGPFLRDVIKLNAEERNFRLFGPDETLSNGLEAVFEATGRQWQAETVPGDEFLAPAGRVMEMLSEHQCEGWLEGYLLTGRHGLFNCYEAFIHIVDSMFNQHAKWLKVSARLPWRKKIASLNYLLASHVWRQDHNGFSHQDPGFIDHVVNKSADVVRVYLPPDANCLLSVMDHCLRSRHYVNVVIAGKHPAPQWLTMDAAARHCARGIGAWRWAGNAGDAEPDAVLACAGDVPTLETLAAVSILRRELPELKIRVVNVVDLMKLQPDTEHPHGLSDADFDALFTVDKPIIFAFHGYPWLIHRLTYRRANHKNLHVRGYKEEGAITTAFDMTVLNDMDRFHLVIDAIDRLPQAAEKGAALKRRLQDKLREHTRYIDLHGEDLPEIRDWKWELAPPSV